MALLERDVNFEYFNKLGVNPHTMLEVLEKYLKMILGDNNLVVYELDPAMIEIDLQYLNHARLFFSRAILHKKHIEKNYRQKNHQLGAAFHSFSNMGGSDVKDNLLLKFLSTIEYLRMHLSWRGAYSNVLRECGLVEEEILDLLKFLRNGKDNIPVVYKK